MTVGQALEDGIKKLTATKISSPHLDAEVLLAWLLKSEREKVLAHPEKKLTLSQNDKFKQLIARRAKYEPIAYIIGSKEFYGLRFKVNKNVLIPRPETEELVELAVQYANNLSPRSQKTAILDVGTGSGCIGLVLKKRLPKTRILGLESSLEALKLARQNAKNLGLSVDFIKSDLLAGFKGNLSDTIIVANLPYLDRQEIKNFSQEIKIGLKFEPSNALYAGPRGLSAYRSLFKQIIKRRQLPQAIFAEIGSTYWRDFLKLAKGCFPDGKIEIIKDLAGRKRFLAIKWK